MTLSVDAVHGKFQNVFICADDLNVSNRQRLYGIGNLFILQHFEIGEAFEVKIFAALQIVKPRLRGSAARFYARQRF